MTGPPAVVSALPPVLDVERLAEVLGAERMARLQESAAAIRELLDGRRLVNVNSTANGGGVAELLSTLVGYARGLGIDSDWLVVPGDPDFFAVTKRIHNWLHGGSGDGRAVDATGRRAYELAMRRCVDGVLARVRPGDVVIVHDPQPAGLVAPLVEHGARVVWRCHIGSDHRNEWTDRAWEFLRPLVAPAHAFVFSRQAYAPGFLDPDRVAVIAPSIDPLSPKNQPLSRADILSLLASAGLLQHSGRTAARHAAPAHVVREGAPPAPRTPLVVQVSRWDRLKDMAGVLEGFTRHVPAASGSQLVLAGPAFSGVADDPEAEEVWNETVEGWRRLPAHERRRVQLAVLPMEDPGENALVVNALQRHAAVVVQKSLAEGFGLTVAEAMWKGRPVVGSAVGGISDQLVDV